MTSNFASSENAFFVEREEVFGLISSLSLQRSNVSDTQLICQDVALYRLRGILDKYLECPTLLDPHLESMVHQLILPARAIVHDLFLNQFAVDSDDKNEEKACGKTDEDKSNEQQDVTVKLSNLMHLLSATYAISKVRGRKYIQRLMPHDAVDVEPVLTILRWFGWIERQERGLIGKSDSAQRVKIPDCIQLLQRQQHEAQDCEAKLWESVHSLLTWLGIISLVPFNLHSIDSSLENVTIDEKSDGNSITLVQSIVSTSASHLGDYGATRETAAACLACLLSRPDLQDLELEGFVEWSVQILYWFRTGQRPCHSKATQLLFPVPDEAPSIFIIMGVLQTLVALVKTGHRSNLLSTEQKLRGIEKLWEQSILVAEKKAAGSVVLRKLFVKLFARIGCSYLPPRVATWRYQRGKRSLVENLMNGTESTQTVDGSSDYFDTNQSSSLSGDDLYLVPDQVEDAADQLLRSLTDPATIVRWSAAKGIGRLTERLPSVCADDVLDAILKICSDPEHDRAWHGACLALAELARRGLLLPERLGEVVPIIVRAIGYDVRRGQHSVGTHVRDASCYTCWAFARAYEPSVLRPYVRMLSVALVLTSLFDREVNCRRAASAAFQESVGRQGADSFKHGIAILTAADYFSLGNRNESFSNISLTISKFEEYQPAIIHHLSDVKLIHWDQEIRQLSSKSLAQIAKLCPTYCASNILPKLLEQCFHDDIVIRHGSLLGCAELVLFFGELKLLHRGGVLDDERMSRLAELVPSIEKARLYRGRGGEIMRAAACRMIECLSQSGLPLTVKQQVRLLDSVDACLIHPKEEIQNSAAEALRSLMRTNFPVSEKGPSTRLQARVIDKYISIVNTEDNPAATRGFSLGLGVLPAKLLAPTHLVLDSVLDCLCSSAAKESLVGGEGDAETRRNSITSLVNICQTVGFEMCEQINSSISPVCPLTRYQSKRVFDSLLSAMEDYNTDRRGDVGSWSRIAAMKGLEALTYLAISASNTFPHNLETTTSKDLSSEALVESVPSVRERVGSVFFHDRSISISSDKYFVPVTYFDEELCSSIMCALLKQLGEKLDAIRCQAGECIERLLTAQSPRVPFVSHRNMLIKALRIGEHNINWSNPAVTFPLLMRAVNIDGFFSPILEGIVVSVGGLTESVSKNSTASLFEWIRVCRQLKATQKILQMGEVFLGLFHRFKRNGRVLIPLLSTLDKLLSHGYLEELLTLNNGNFIRNLITSLSNEASGCSDVKRLLAIVRVTLNMIQLDLETSAAMRESVLPLAMSLLLNPYPRVRQYTAEQLYVKIEEDGDKLFGSQASLEEATHLLLNVAWHDECDDHGHIVKARNQIADLLGVALSEEARHVTLGTTASRTVLKDEFESYSSLINSA
eukprot:scaffold19153_cov80-Skeletonema_menzelii.AAC.9